MRASAALLLLPPILPVAILLFLDDEIGLHQAGFRHEPVDRDLELLRLDEARGKTAHSRNAKDLRYAELSFIAFSWL